MVEVDMRGRRATRTPGAGANGTRSGSAESPMPVQRRSLTTSFRLAIQIAAIASLGTELLAQAIDTDGDGLSDFQEANKYRTDPESADSDRDGVPDGDWYERREYQYWVRSVVQVLRPVTPKFLNDDYQDARVLDATDEYVELEVIHYPFNSVADAIEADPDWRRTVGERSELAPWLAPGPTSDVTPELEERLAADLAADGIDVTSLDDRAVAARVSEWLLDRAESVDGFSTFITAFDEAGRPFLPESLRRGRAPAELEAQWEREVSASGMYRHGRRGTCTSSAIYLSGCLRAVGLPTRTVLCIPVVDASDERELELVTRGIEHPRVRRTLLAALDRLRGAWASHTFNEVWVGGRWRRLNYERLGQNTYDPDLFGLMTHVATFRDWADARMPETIGARQAGSRRDDVFGGPNPYSTIALRDAFGPHCTLDRSEDEPIEVRIEDLWWSDDEALPERILAGMEPAGRFGLVARVRSDDGDAGLKAALLLGDRRVWLEAPDHRLGIGFDPGCAWFEGGRAWFHIAFGPADREGIRSGVEYTVRPSNGSRDYRWVLDGGCTKLVR